MMVRINLLPGKKRGAAGGALWRLVAVMLVLFLAELMLLYFVYDGKATELQQRTAQLKKAQSEVTKLEQEVASLPEAEKRAADLEAREKALAELARFRQGPQHVLDEIKRVMSRPKTKLAIRQAKAAGWNVAWDAENVFLSKFGEESKKAVGVGSLQFEGFARSLDDVAEFWLRMRSSKLFANVRLVRIEEAKVKEAGVDMQKFVFTAQANFHYETKEGRALKEQLEAAEKANEAGGEPPAEKQEKE